jgi:hypothetical protein
MQNVTDITEQNPLFNTFYAEFFQLIQNKNCQKYIHTCNLTWCNQMCQTQIVTSKIMCKYIQQGEG